MNDDLPKLPPLEEVLRSARTVSPSKGSSQKAESRQIIEINCPILERGLIEEGKGGMANVHLVGERVVCEKHMTNRQVGGRYFSGCMLLYRYRGRFGTGSIDELEFDPCPYKQ